MDERRADAEDASRLAHREVRGPDDVLSRQRGAGTAQAPASSANALEAALTFRDSGAFNSARVGEGGHFCRGEAWPAGRQCRVIAFRFRNREAQLRADRKGQLTANVLSFSPSPPGQIPSLQAEELACCRPIALAQRVGRSMAIRFIPHGDLLIRYASGLA